MKKLLIFAALALASAPAHAQGGFTFDINGQRVHIAVPKHCDNDERCVSVSTGRPGAGRGEEQQIDASKLRDIFSGFMAGRSPGGDPDDDDIAPRKPARVEPKSRATIGTARTPEAASPAATIATAPAPAASAPANVAPPTVALPAPGSLKPNTPAPAATALATPGPADGATPKPAPVNPSIPSAPVAPARAPSSAAPGPVAALPPEPAAESTEASPAGIWVTQNNEARVHIKSCGENFCGYVLDPKSKHNGEKVLIDMRLMKDNRWSGHVHDPKGGGTYDATMSLKSQDTLAIRGCAMGGLFCKGQTWTRG